jgi:NADPH:quinone reductase-like Zn-dependent oxidoreductase
MKAIVQDRYGTADVLELRDIDQPAIGDDDVLVRVHAAGVHIGDWHVMTGLPYLLRIIGFGLRAPRARVRGTDVAGTVAAVGRHVAHVRPGDEVFGTGDGAFAEYARARADTLAPKPATLTFAQAAAVPTSACTALQALRDVGGIRPGQRVLLVGASGGVGLFAVQLAKAFGAEVTGVCGTAKVELVRALGADRVIDYTREDFTLSGRRYDLILDLGGNRPLAQLRRALAPRGTLVLVGGEGGDRWTGAVGRSVRALAASPFVSQRLRGVLGTAKTADLRFLKELVEAGTVMPVLDRTYALRDAPDAMRRLAAGHARGKLVVTVRGADHRAAVEVREALPHQGQGHAREEVAIAV